MASPLNRDAIHPPDTIEDGEHQQRIFGRLAKRFSLLDQLACQLQRRLGFRRRIAFDGHQSVGEGDLKP